MAPVSVQAGGARFDGIMKVVHGRQGASSLPDDS